MLARLTNDVNRAIFHGQVSTDYFMGLRGPKPVDLNLLEGEAVQWACFFYTLRDGQPGHMQKVIWDPVQRTGSEPWTPVPSGRGTVMLPPNTEYRTSKPVGPLVLIRIPKGAERLPQQMTAEDWDISRPIIPKPEVWEKLTRAHTVSKIEQAVTGIGELKDAYVSSTPWALNPGGAISHFAKEILVAKRLAHYPKTRREKSDDKRVVFLAKVMAGLVHGLAPITAVKRLSHWDLPRDWAEKNLAQLTQASYDHGPVQITWQGDLWARGEISQEQISETRSSKSPSVTKGEKP